MNCVWCDREINVGLDWKNVLLPPKEKFICSSCEQQLILIDGSTCDRCGRSSDDRFCRDCHMWTEQFKVDPLKKNVAVFSYNDFLKNIITRWKYRGDYILVHMFKDYLRQYFYKFYKEIYKEAMIVPIPLSEERLLERRFNQAEALAHLLGHEELLLCTILERKHSEKQSKRSRTERIKSENPFMMKTSIQKPVILIDDLYTTGTTLRHAAIVLKANGCPKVYSITLARG